MTPRTAPAKPTPTHAAGCFKCKAEARMIHNRRHQSPEGQALVQQMEAAYAALEVEFQHERDAELAALARGVRPVPGQWKLDQQRLAAGEPAPTAIPAVKVEPPPILVIYRDLWHGEVAS